MNTPICDFVERYGRSGAVRMHMPGHKGRAFLGCEGADITEIDGADWLYGPRGIIRESEGNAAGLFGAERTLYSTEGSSQCIRAMLYLAALAALERRPGERPLVVAGRNAHKAFLTAAALLDLDVSWLYPEDPGGFSLCRCAVSAGQLESALRARPQAAAVFLTSPDYLGNEADLPALSAVARRRGVPLLVDNAHGAYRAFLRPSRHPMAQGADLCCDSAHKTLPVLTGGAYLHLGGGVPEVFRRRAREAMAMFGSTSPSYLVLQSLDRANRCLAEDYPGRLAASAAALAGLKGRLAQRGWRFAGSEPMKLTLNARARGYTGGELGAALGAAGIVCEYADPDYVVLMPTPENTPEELARLEQALSALPVRPALAAGGLRFRPPERAMSIRQAMLAPSEELSPEQAVGRVAAGLPASCPPAVAPVVPGERVSAEAAEVFRYYGAARVSVCREAGASGKPPEKGTAFADGACGPGAAVV